jgi:hypothetical protein
VGIGVAVFANRDISEVVSTQQQALPGSGRRYHFSDRECLQSTAPTQYVQFNSNGIAVVSPNNVTVRPPSISIGASGSSTQPLVTDAFITYWTTKVYRPATQTRTHAFLGRS